MDLAYRSFFKGGGFPKFASKRKVNSFVVRNNCHIRENQVKIQNIGWLKMVKDSPVIGKIKRITVKKQSGCYYACITTDAMKGIRNQDENQILALDAGLARFMTGSDGSIIENPRHFRKYEKRLRIENRSLARKKRFGKNWQKQAKRLSRLHSKIANVRKDFLHKESTQIAKKANIVVLEDLNVAGISRGNLSKHILDVGWATFRQMLAYKTEVIAINPRFTSQTCNDCGVTDKKSRISQSKFVCTNCGATTNADDNASLNILRQGMVVISKRKAVA